MPGTAHELSSPWEAVLLEPHTPNGAAVIVLSGSSGRIDRQRTELLAEQGFLTLAIRWFGGPGQPAGICEVPLETFVAAVDLLDSRGARRISILGWSKGAEAALLTAVHEPRVDAVVAVSPTALTWCNLGPGLDGRQRPYRSGWTWQGQPLPFVPLDDTWFEADHGEGPVAVRSSYDLSERTFADRLATAAIPVERMSADLLLIAGGDDEMWGSLRYAEQLAARRRAAGLPVRLVARADAGHRVRFPGETPAPPSPVYLYGGTDEANARLGAAAWEPILSTLALP
ncbi:acyl-CoA thioester hydrolase/BAAT C-terminal domain-containing protein [Kitasatospora sp. NPDC006697]|uniref:acyl-CoA thioester hydrolase/BAAT C-terminal domain-containing protein n=1 Tax=Kitasatospora sp. NPDC006697 TaxID=3364020 RepID=UPI003698C4E4